MACYNVDKHEPILTIFGSNVALKVSNQKMFFSTSPKQCFCTTLQNAESQNCMFYSNAVLLHCQTK